MPHDVERSCNFLRKSPINQILYTQMDFKYGLNRYRRGLETCPQAKTSKGGHAIVFSCFQRVRATRTTQRRVKNTRVHFWTFSPVSVNFLARLLIKKQSKSGSIEF